MRQTANETREEMISKLGRDFGLLLYSLYNEINWLTLRWAEYKELYGEKKSRVDLLNKSAPFFFYLVQKVLWENLMLGVCRITDPTKSGGERNLTLKAIPRHLKEPKFRTEIASDIKDLCETATFCRDWRDRWISHINYDLATDRQNAEPLVGASKAKLKLTIRKIHALYNKIEFKYLNTTTAFAMVQGHRGALNLMCVIEDGLRFDKDTYERKIAGTWVDEGFQSLV